MSARVETVPERRLARFGHEEQGAAAVEFALVLPVLLMLVFMFIDATRAFYTLNSLVSAAREGARFASAQELTCPVPTAAEQDQIKDRVLQSAVLFGGTQLTRGYVQVTVDPSPAALCENVHVRIQSYPFRPITPVARLFRADSILMTREAVFRYERGP